MTHLKQQTENDCYLTCAANATGVDYYATFSEEFRAKVEANPGVSGNMVTEVWKMCGLEENRDYLYLYMGHNAFPYRTLQHLLWGRRAVLSVPSLNNPPPGLHAVYWDGVELHDPSNKQTYKYLEQCFPQSIILFHETRIECESPNPQ